MFFLTIMTSAYGAVSATPGPSAPSPTPFATALTDFGTSPVDFTWLFVKMVLAMVIVIGLAIVTIRYVIPKLAMVRTRGSVAGLKILDRIPLDSRKAIYIIQVEGRRLLVGVSENHIGLLTELKREDENDSSA